MLVGRMFRRKGRRSGHPGRIKRPIASARAKKVVIQRSILCRVGEATARPETQSCLADVLPWGAVKVAVAAADNSLRKGVERGGC